MGGQKPSCDLRNYLNTRIWASAQRDGRPAKYRWRPLFNVAKFGWRPLPQCRAVMLPSRESRWNLQGCPKLAHRSQPLVGRSSPYYEDMWRRYWCLTIFFRLSICALRRYSPTTLCDGAQMSNFWRFSGPAFPASRVQHISDLHSKFALGHTRRGSIWQTSNLRRLSILWRLRLGEEKRKKEQTTEQKYSLMVCPVP